MAVWTELLGEYDSETTAFTALAGGAGASPFTPAADGTLRRLRVVINRSAATSLINHVEFRLKCKTFGGVDVEVGGQGSGLQTAPALQGGAVAESQWEINVPVKAGNPITIEARNVTADTPVTVSALLYGTFEG